MDKIKWVELAKSKDKARENITKLYRDKTSLVATDVSRLHQIINLPDATPHYVDNSVGDFPEYTQIIPKDAPRHYFTMPAFNQGKEILKDLKALDAVIKRTTKGDRIVKAEINDNKLCISYECKTYTSDNLISFYYSIEGVDTHHVNDTETIQFGMQLPFLIDALSNCEEHSIIMGVRDNLKPVTFETTETFALVAACRIN